jgi:hypothetical protein
MWNHPSTMDLPARPHRARSGRLRWLVLSALAVSVLAGGFWGCTLPRGGTLQQSCTSDPQCDDGVPCTTDRCSPEGFCEWEADPAAVVTQVPGDCLVTECQGLFLVAVPANDPPDDDNPCTDDFCSDGTPIHQPLPDETTCFAPEGAGQCKAGACEVSCTTVAMCDDQNDCTIDSCDPTLSICQHEDLHNVAASSQTEGDCKIRLCQQGDPIESVDNGDLPDDGDDCTLDQCIEGIPTHTPEPTGSPCGDASDPLAKLCNASASCVQCLFPADCSHLPPNDQCRTRTCSPAGVCGESFTAANTPLTSQTTGDCKQVVCDGAGSATAITDASDLPVDLLDCTEDICTGDVPSNPPLSAGAPCGNGVCDGTGTCLGCLAPSDCGADTFCLSWSCPANTCQANFTANDTPLPGQVPQDCTEERCDGAGGVKQSPIFEPLVDGNDCTDDLCQGTTPVNPPSALNSACSQNGGSWCDGAGSCVECNDATQCSQSDDTCEADQCSSNVCVVVFDPPGAPAPLSEQTPGDCQTLVCDGAGNVQPTPVVNDLDLPVDGFDCTDDVCTTGVPSNPASPIETPCTENGGVVCNGQSVCVACATDNQCAAVEGCDTASWSCKLDPGQPCGSGGECLSGFCSDGLCCNGACGGSCEACNLPTSPGACTAIPAGQDPDDECPAGACNGALACALDHGQACGAATDCLSGFCSDELCCNMACGGLCEACDLPGSEGACNPVPFGSDPDAECAAGSCDGAFGCKLDSGAPCSSGSECLSGVCAGTCQAASCGDGIVNGSETCDPGDPATPCCDPQDCDGAAPAGTACGGDPDGGGCGAAPTCDGGSLQITSCITQTQPDGTLCTPDGLFCNGAEICTGGACVSPGDPCDGADGDANCSEQCDEATDTCSAPDPNGSPCDDGLFCNGSEVCTAGVCGSSSGDPCPGANGDGNCAETCDEASNTCTAPDPDGVPCDDGIYCNGSEVCTAGLCGSSSGDPCPGADGDGDCSESCDEVMQTCTAPDLDGSPCDDGFYCNGTEICTAGICASSSGDPCPGPDGDTDCQESCHESSASCSANDPEMSLCDDGDGQCIMGTCISIP